ncbi:hypothetical protein DYB38_001483 [Aphanomyces astaci]|uniref:Major facilitator superfamily (MFS) profile domain-containing protein n=3 Tax=Aphanomyces astaci TaxID=112090 RepID=A0A397D3D4_APHAT|nr:hypothetical protein DYB38_001483 [Aphanomyces astaci]RHZ31574.1 hypothetical protein DYB31_002395 [Aphanomyces astaci]
MHVGDERPGCSLVFFLLVCAPTMAVKMSWSAQWAALGPILNDILEDSWRTQLVQLIGPITGIIIAPAVGVHSDRNTSKYGQRRPYIFLSALSTILCWCVMAYLKVWFEDQPTVFGMLTILCYVWMDVTVNILQTVTFLLISDVAGPRQVTGSAIAHMYGVLGQMVVSIYISLAKNPRNDPQPFFALLIAVMFVTVMPVCYFVRENPWEAMRRIAPGSTFDHPAITSVYPAQTVGIWTAWYVGIKTLPGPLFVYWLAGLCLQYGYQSYNGVKTVFFGENVMNGTQSSCRRGSSSCTAAQTRYHDGEDLSTGAADQFYNALAMFTLVFLPLLVQKFGVRRVVLFAFFPHCFILAMALYHPQAFAVIVVGLTAFGQICVFVLQVPLILHVVANFRDEKVLGLYLGAFNTATCLGQMLMFVTAGLVNRFAASVRQGNVVAILIGGVFSVCALLLVFFKFHVKLHSW